MTEEKSTRALTGERQFHKSFQGANVTYTDLEGWQINEIFDSAQYRFIDDTNKTLGFYIEDYFDTSGYTRDYLTTMPTQAQMQEAGVVQFIDSQNSRLLFVDFMMTDRIDDIPGFAARVQQINSYPSFPSSNYEWEQIIYGRTRQFTGIVQPVAGTQTLQDVFTNVSDNQFGSLGATTADKIWIYRFVIIQGIPGTLVTIKTPNFRAVLNANIIQEPTDAYMMRQKRSYELDNY